MRALVRALVAELVDALVSGISGCKAVGVQVPSRAPISRSIPILPEFLVLSSNSGNSGISALRGSGWQVGTIRILKLDFTAPVHRHALRPNCL